MCVLHAGARIPRRRSSVMWYRSLTLFRVHTQCCLTASHCTCLWGDNTVCKENLSHHYGHCLHTPNMSSAALPCKFIDGCLLVSKTSQRQLYPLCSCVRVRGIVADSLLAACTGTLLKLIHRLFNVTLCRRGMRRRRVCKRIGVVPPVFANIRTILGCRPQHIFTPTWTFLSVEIEFYDIEDGACAISMSNYHCASKISKCR